MENKSKHEILCERLDKEYTDFINSLQSSDNPSVVAKVFEANALNIFICNEIIYRINEYGADPENGLSEKELDTLLKLDNTLLSLCYGQIDYGQAELSLDNMIPSIKQFSKVLADTDERFLNTGSREKASSILGVIKRVKNEEKLDFNDIFIRKLREEHNCNLIWNNGKYNIFSSEGNKIGSYKLWDLPYSEGVLSLNYNNYPLLTHKIKADYDNLKSGTDMYNSSIPFPKTKNYDGIHNYRKALEYNGKVLGIQYNEVGNRFVCATWSKGITGDLCNGHYSMEYNDAISDFNYRSQMIPTTSIMGYKEIENILHTESAFCNLSETTYSKLCKTYEQRNKMRIENEGYHVFHDIIPLSTADIKTLIEAGNDITVEQYHSDGIPYSVHINDIDLTKDFIGGIKKEVMWDYEDVHSSIITKAFQKISENKNVLDLTTDDYLISR